MQKTLFEPEILKPTPTVPKPKRKGSAGSPGPRRENSMVVKYHPGDVVGKLTLIKRHGKGKWLTRCECGREGIREPGQHKSCLWCRPVKKMVRSEGGELYRELKSGRQKYKNAEERRLTVGYNTAYHNAKNKGFAFALTRDQYKELTSKACEYCGGKLPEKGSGLDRILCQEGYTLANCVACCTICNRVKGETFTYREMKLLGSVIRNLLNARTSPVQGLHLSQN